MSKSFQLKSSHPSREIIFGNLITNCFIFMFQNVQWQYIENSWPMVELFPPTRLRSLDLISQNE